MELYVNINISFINSVITFSSHLSANITLMASNNKEMSYKNNLMHNMNVFIDKRWEAFVLPDVLACSLHEFYPT